MSGNDERKRNCVCPECGGTRFESIGYGFRVYIVDVEHQDLHDEGWEQEENDGWKCFNCGIYLTGETLRIIENSDWYNW